MKPLNTLLLALATLLLIVLGGGLYFISSNKTSDTSVIPVSLSSLFTPTRTTPNNSQNNQTTQASSTTFELKGVDGMLPARDFLSDQDIASSTELGSFLYWAETLTEGSSKTPSYEIYFLEKDSLFIVVLLQEPIGEVRRSATNALVEKLGINQEDVCKLSAEVNVPYYVNEFYSAQNLGFPNCEGSVKFSGD
ncbi:hypothetical protein EPO56_03370 [Patescibacteria group bacterium]|nr:MAG: hypothetical protein EPO56_03370 [Patescibacteria group bacterium]